MKIIPLKSVCLLIFTFSIATTACSCSDEDTLDISSIDTVGIGELDMYGNTDTEPVTETYHITEATGSVTTADTDDTSPLTMSETETETTSVMTDTAAIGIHTSAPVPAVTGPIQNSEVPTASQSSEKTYVLNTNTKRFHYSDCSSVKQIKDKNKGSYTGTRDELIAQGYKSCGNCHP